MEKPYQPGNIQFVLPAETESSFPLQLFDGITTLDDARKEISSCMVAFNEPITAQRFMDEKELSDIRSSYSSELETVLPELETQAAEAEAMVREAKERAHQAMEQVRACLMRIKEMAQIAKSGVTDMELSATEVFKVPVNGKYLYYVYAGNALKLAMVKDIPDNERRDLMNLCNKNAQVFENIMNASRVAING